MMIVISRVQGLVICAEPGFLCLTLMRYLCPGTLLLKLYLSSNFHVERFWVCKKSVVKVLNPLCTMLRLPGFWRTTKLKNCICEYILLYLKRKISQINTYDNWSGVLYCSLLFALLDKYYTHRVGECQRWCTVGIQLLDFLSCNNRMNWNNRWISVSLFIDGSRSVPMLV